MTAKKETTKEEAKTVAPETKETVKETPETTPVDETVDETLESAKAESSSVDAPLVEMADDDKAKEVIEADQEVKDKLEDGSLSVNAHTASILQKPLVADPQSGQPKYETNEQAMAALSAAGKLVTPASE